MSSIVEGCNEAFLMSSPEWTSPAPSKNLFIRAVLHPSEHLCGLLLQPMTTTLCLYCLGGSRTGWSSPDEASHGQSTEGQSPPSPCWPSLFDAVQDALGLPGCKHTLLVHVELFVHHHPQVHLFRAALDESFSQSIHVRDCPNPNITPFSWPCWTSP